MFTSPSPLNIVKKLSLFVLVMVLAAACSSASNSTPYTKISDAKLTPVRLFPTTGDTFITITGKIGTSNAPDNTVLIDARRHRDPDAG